MSASTIVQFPVQPEPDPTPPASPCWMCRGSRYIETWLPDYQTGGTVCTGAFRCTACDDPLWTNGHKGELSKSDQQIVAESVAAFERDYDDAVIDEANHQLERATMIDRGELFSDDDPDWWREEAGRALSNVRYIDQDLDRYYRVAARTGEEPDPETIRPLEERRAVWVDVFSDAQHQVHLREQGQVAS